MDLEMTRLRGNSDIKFGSVNLWRMPARMVFVALALVMSCLFLTACSGADSSETEPSKSPLMEGIEIVNSPEPGLATDVDDPREGGGPRRGGVFMIPSGNWLIPDAALFEPSSATEPLLGEIYSGLMQLSEDPNDALKTDLAERYEIHDGVKYEFTLKRDLKFSDGSPVTALDFKWSWERALLPSTGLNHAREVLGLIVGAAEVLEGATEELEGVEAVDDRTLIVTLSEPSAIFPFLLADPVAAVLKRENVEKWGVDFSDYSVRPSVDVFEEFPVGTGPFELAVFDTLNAEFVLTRNEHYHEGAPYLDGIVFVTDLFEEQNGRMVANLDRAFQERQIDWTLASTRSDRNEFGGEIISVFDGKRSDFLMFNSGLPPYDDLIFRRALIGSVELISHHEEDEQHSIPGSLIPPLLSGHDPELSGIPYDLDEANADISKSQYGDQKATFRPTFQTDLDGHFEDEFGFLSKSWKEGIGVGEGRYQYTRSDVYLERLENGEIEMRFIDVDARYPNGLAVLSEMRLAFGSGELSLEQAELDNMIESAQTESDAVKRLELYSDIQRYALERALVIPFEWPSSAGSGISLQPWVNGYREPAFHGSRFRNVWFDDTAPERELSLP